MLRRDLFRSRRERYDACCNLATFLQNSRFARYVQAHASIDSIQRTENETYVSVGITLQTGFYIINVNNEKICFLNKPIRTYLF